MGNFEPTLAKTSEFEIAVKKYKAGDRESSHYHKVAREFTVIIDGTFKMNEVIVNAGDIIEVEPGETIAFECLAEGANVVVKIPSVNGDKYVTEERLVSRSAKRLNIVIPMAGQGKSFAQAGYTFPKPLIDVGGKPMIQWVIENVRPKCNHRFVFICLKDHFDKYSLVDIFNNSAGNDYEVVLLNNKTGGAACTALTAVDYFNDENDLMIVNSDQYIEADINDFIDFSRKNNASGSILTFQSNHPRWSYAKVDGDNTVIETAEKKVISNHATAGIYYFSSGLKFVQAVSSMIEKQITYNGEYYICPVYNEFVLAGKSIKIWEIERSKMHGMGTIEDLVQFLSYTGKQG